MRGGSGGGGGTSDGDGGGSGGGDGDGDSGSGGGGEGGARRLTYTPVLEFTRKVEQYFQAPPSRWPIMVLALLSSWSILRELPPAAAAFRLVFLGKCHEDTLPLRTSLIIRG